MPITSGVVVLATPLRDSGAKAREGRMDELGRLRRPRLPCAGLLGMAYLSASKERVTAELMVRDELCTRPAVLHGGAIMAFADTLGAAATVLNLPAGAWTTTIQSKANFFAPPPPPRKTAPPPPPSPPAPRTPSSQ